MTWRLVLEDGSGVGYGSGVVQLLEAMTLTRSGARLLAYVPARILDGAYRVVARHREKLGRLVPDGPGPRRFP